MFTARNGRLLLVLEGYRGSANLQPGDGLEPGFDGRPDLQVQVDRPLGNGSTKVCDTGPPPIGGGVPAVVPVRYDENEVAVTDALNDFACRFETFDRSGACTRTDATGDSRFVDLTADRQYCDIVSATAEFPPGDTVVTARLRDVGGNVGPTAQIVVRVATPTPVRSVR